MAVHICAVEALELIAGRQAEEDHVDLGFLGELDRLVCEAISVALILGADRNPGRERDLRASGHTSAHFVECSVLARRVRLRTAGSLEASAAGELADDRDP